MDKHIFYRCSTPAQAAVLVPKYAKYFGITQDTVCRILWRFHGLSVDQDMIRKFARRMPTWATDSRACAARVPNKAPKPSSTDFLKKYCQA